MMFNEEFDVKWVNKYSIRCDRLVNKLKVPINSKASYGLIYRFHEFLNKLNLWK